MFVLTQFSVCVCMAGVLAIKQYICFFLQVILLYNLWVTWRVYSCQEYRNTRVRSNCILTHTKSFYLFLQKAHTRTHNAQWIRKMKMENIPQINPITHFSFAILWAKYPNWFWDWCVARTIGQSGSTYSMEDILRKCEIYIPIHKIAHVRYTFNQMRFCCARKAPTTQIPWY